jgi:hypothetical protein
MKGQCMPKYLIETNYKWQGIFHIKASDEQLAKEIVKSTCKLSLSTTMPHELIDWDFPAAPSPTILSVTEAEN